MKNSFRILSIVLAFVIFFALSAATALAQSGYTYTASVSQSVSTSCSSGETINLSGNLQFQYSVTQDPSNGDNRFQIGILSSLSGVGQVTQANYVESDSYSYGVTSTGSSVQITLQLQPTLVSQGSSPNLTLPQAVTVTADTSGNISATVANGSTTCGS